MRVGAVEEPASRVGELQAHEVRGPALHYEPRQGYARAHRPPREFHDGSKLRGALRVEERLLELVRVDGACLVHQEELRNVQSERTMHLRQALGAVRASPLSEGIDANGADFAPG